MKIGEFYFDYNESPNYSIIDRVDRDPDNFTLIEDSRDDRQIIIDEWIYFLILLIWIYIIYKYGGNRLFRY